MTQEQLKSFLEKVKGNTTLQEQLKAAADNDAVVAIAKAAGFSLSADDISKAKSELSEQELEVVAGGLGINGPVTNGKGTKAPCDTGPRCQTAP